MYHLVTSVIFWHFFYLELLLCFSGLCQQLCLYLQISTYLPKCLHPSQCFVHSTAATAKSLQLCPTLCDPIDGSPLGFSIPGILQARTLEWVAISFSNAWKWKVKVKSLSRVWLLATHGLQPTRLLRPWDSPGKNTRVGCHFLLQCMKV